MSPVRRNGTSSCHDVDLVTLAYSVVSMIPGVVLLMFIALISLRVRSPWMGWAGWMVGQA